MSVPSRRVGSGASPWDVVGAGGSGRRYPLKRYLAPDEEQARRVYRHISDPVDGAWGQGPSLAGAHP